jgi:hypothetical protein
LIGPLQLISGADREEADFKIGPLDRRSLASPTIGGRFFGTMQPWTAPIGLSTRLKAFLTVDPQHVGRILVCFSPSAWGTFLDVPGLAKGGARGRARIQREALNPALQAIKGNSDVTVLPPATRPANKGCLWDGIR